MSDLKIDIEADLKVDVEAELKKFDAEQAKTAKDNRIAKEAYLKRKAQVFNDLSKIINEKDTEIISETLNVLLPWITKNISHADISLIAELTKKSDTNQVETKEPTQNLGRTYLIIDSKKLKSKSEELYNSLIEKVGVATFEKNKDQLVVVAKNYGPSFKKLVESLGYSSIPKTKGKKEVSATAVMLKEFTVAKKVIKDKNIDTIDIVKAKSLEYFDSSLTE